MARDDISDRQKINPRDYFSEGELGNSGAKRIDPRDYIAPNERGGKRDESEE